MRRTIAGSGEVVFIEPGLVSPLHKTGDHAMPKLVCASDAMSDLDGIGRCLNPLYNAMLDSMHDAAVEWDGLGKVGGQRDDHAAKLLTTVSGNLDRLIAKAEIVRKQLHTLTMPAYGYSQTDLTRFRETGIDPHAITSGTGSGPEVGGCGMPKYRWARYGIWSLKYWPDGGGAQGFVDVPGIGTVVDVDDEMPHEVWVAMLAAVDSPLCL